MKTRKTTSDRLEKIARRRLAKSLSERQTEGRIRLVLRLAGVQQELKRKALKECFAAWTCTASGVVLFVVTAII